MQLRDACPEKTRLLLRALPTRCRDASGRAIASPGSPIPKRVFVLFCKRQFGIKKTLLDNFKRVPSLEDPARERIQAWTTSCGRKFQRNVEKSRSDS
ncbi:hypothetical protein TNCV_4417311 [Trichonephila clavipes]|nr:hypothetical protein TNCV_4417311 [Trichonephila clavipes]